MIDVDQQINSVRRTVGTRVEGDHAVCISDPAQFSAKLLEACLGTQTASSS